jgi:hypothetical protein
VSANFFNAAVTAAAAAAATHGQENRKFPNQFILFYGAGMMETSPPTIFSLRLR